MVNLITQYNVSDPISITIRQKNFAVRILVGHISQLLMFSVENKYTEQFLLSPQYFQNSSASEASQKGLYVVKG